MNGGVRFQSSLSACGIAATTGSGTVLKPPARVAGLDNIAMMREAVEHRGRHLGVVEHLGPIGESEIGADQQRSIFIELADQVEQQLTAGLAEWQIAEFVDDDEIEAQEFFAKPAAPPGRFLLLQLIDKINQIEEAPLGARANDR